MIYKYSIGQSIHFKRLPKKTLLFNRITPVRRVEQTFTEYEDCDDSEDYYYDDEEGDS